MTIEIIAAYGSHLVTLADQIHHAASTTLAVVLGDYAPTAAAILTHVHIGDITDDLRDVL